MNEPTLFVAPGRAGAHATIAEALRAAPAGALIRLAPGTYAEELVITAPVTLAADGDPGRVHLHAQAGSAIVAEAAVRLAGLSLSSDDPEAPVIDVCDGLVELDRCQVSGRAWAAVLARDTATVSLRDCEIGNDYGAGIVIVSSGGNVVADTVIRDVASSAVVVAGDGRLTLLRARLDRPGGNGLMVNGQAHLASEDTSITGAVKPAVAVEEDAAADLIRLAVTTDTGPGGHLASQGPTTLTDCSFLVRDASQPAILVAAGAAARCDGLTVTGGAAGVRIEDGAALTLTRSDVSADGDGIQVLDGGTLIADRSRASGANGVGLNVAPAGTADLTSCDIDDVGETPAEAAPVAATDGPSAGSAAGEPSLHLVRADHVRVGPGRADPVLSRLAVSPASEPPPDAAGDLEHSPSARLIGDLVGLDSVRRAVSGRLAELVRRRADGPGQPSGAAMNLAFAGHDGSGRRAVAELYAAALAELGFLPTGALTWAPLADFPARWPGQPGRYADWLLARSRGGLLLLEADDIFWQWPEDRRALVRAELPGAVRRSPDAAIVLSGEPQLLPALLSEDPELAECFPSVVRFDPYQPAELAELTIRRLTARGCDIGNGVRAALTGYFRQAEPTTDVRGAARAWDAHQLAVYLGELVSGPEITTADVFSAMRGD